MKKENNKPYSAKRWTDIPVPDVIGHKESIPEEKEQYDKDMEIIMKQYGVINSDEKVINGKIVKK